MDKATKEQFTLHRDSLYNIHWIEKAATKGYKNFIEAFNCGLPEGKNKIKPRDNRFLAILYYAAFEDALKTFLQQVLEDHITDIQLCLNEMMELTAEMKTDLTNEDKK